MSRVIKGMLVVLGMGAMAMGLALIPTPDSEVAAWGGYTCDSTTVGSESSWCHAFVGNGDLSASTTHTRAWANTHACNASVTCPDGSKKTCSRSDDGMCMSLYNATDAYVDCGSTIHCD